MRRWGRRAASGGYGNALAPLQGAATSPRARRRARIRRLVDLLPLALVAALLVVRIWDPLPVAILRQQVFDLYQRIQPRPAVASPRVLIVDIDDRSLGLIGQWPWPRTVLADLLHRIVADGAVAVAFDILFAEPDRLSPASIAAHVAILDPVVAGRLRALPSNDEVFAHALEGSPTVLAEVPVPDPAAGDAGGPATRAAVAEIGGDPRPYLLHYGGIIRDLAPLEAAAAGLGSILVAPEADNVARRVPLVVDVGGRVVPALAVEMLRVAAGGQSIAVKVNEAGIQSVVAGDHLIQTDGLGQKWVYFSASDPRRYVSAADVLQGRVPPGRFAGRYVVIGTSATALGDIKATPTALAMPGAEVHAQLIENILDKVDLERPSEALGAELVLILTTSLLLIALMPRLGALPTLLLGAGMSVIVAGGSWYLFRVRSLLLDVSFPALAGLAVYGLLMYVKYLREEGTRKSIRRAFDRYLSAELIDRLIADPGQLVLGGETREATVLFADIRNFTALSEGLKAEALTELVNRVLTAQTTAIQRHGGTIDKYIGDAVMAFWNAPLRDPEHERHACRAALDLLSSVAALNETLKAESRERPVAWPELRVGVGLNSGLCCIGNMGSAQRFNYSVLGNPVNLASRLEEQTKTYGCPIVVGHETVIAAGEMAFIELDVVRVRGKLQPTRIHALLGDRDLARSPSFVALRETHDRMLEAYRAGRLDEARHRLGACRAQRGDLPLAILYDLYERRLTAERFDPVGAEPHGHLEIEEPGAA